MDDKDAQRMVDEILKNFFFVSVGLPTLSLRMIRMPREWWMKSYKIFSLYL